MARFANTVLANLIKPCNTDYNLITVSTGKLAIYSISWIKLPCQYNDFTSSVIWHKVLECWFRDVSL